MSTTTTREKLLSVKSVIPSRPAAPDRYRELFLSLLGGAGRPESLWILVTSAVRGEGVTSTAQGLAMAMSAHGPTVLLEANWRHSNPDLARAGSGVTLEQAASSPDALLGVLPGDENPLAIVPSGSGFESADAGSLAALVKWLRTRCRFGVLDVPPVLEYPDALQFAGSVDGCILVVEAGRTSWHASARARDLLQGAGLSVLGVVLNKRRFPIPSLIYRRLP